MNEFLQDMILTELEDAVGRENCSMREIDRMTHGVDYFWLSRMWADRGLRMPEADVIVSPRDAEETSAVLKIANYYKIPVTTWGGGGAAGGRRYPAGYETDEHHCAAEHTVYVCGMWYRRYLQACGVGGQPAGICYHALSQFPDLLDGRRILGSPGHRGSVY